MSVDSDSLVLEDLHDHEIVDTAECEIDVLNDMEKAETVSRKDLMNSFSKFDSIVGSMDSMDVFMADTDDDDGYGSDDSMMKMFMDHYEAEQSDITANLKAFQSSFEFKPKQREDHEEDEAFQDHYEAVQADITASLKAFQADFDMNNKLPEKQEKKEETKRKGLGTKKLADRNVNVKRKHSVERRIEEALPKSKPEVVATSPDAVQDIINEVPLPPPNPPPLPPRTPTQPPKGSFRPPPREDLTGWIISFDPSVDPLEQPLPPLITRATKLPDPSTMTAKEILKELVEHCDEKPNFMEKSEIVKALAEARSKAKPEVTRLRSKAAGRLDAPRTPRASRSRGRSISCEPSPRSRTVSPVRPSRADNDAPRTPGASRKSRGRSSSAEPSPRCQTASPIRSHLKSLKDLMELKDPEGLETATPGRRRKKRIGQKKNMSNSLSTLDFHETELETLKRSSSWWNLGGGGGDDEGSKNSKSTTSKQKKDWKKVLSGNDLGGEDGASKSSKSTNSKRKNGWKKVLSSRALGVEDEGSKSSKSTNSKRKKDFRRILSSNDIRADEDGGSKSSKSTNSKKKTGLRRARSSNDLGVDDDAALYSNDDGSKSSKSTNSKRKKGLRRILSGNDVDDEPKDGESNTANKSWDKTPKRRNKSNKVGKSNHHELERLKKEIKKGNWWNNTGKPAAEESPKSSKESKNSSRKKGMRKSRSGNDINDIADNDDKSATDTPRSRRRKKGLRKSMSGPTLEIDDLPFGLSKPKANANWNVSPGANKQRRKMSLRRSTSNPEVNAEDGDSSKSSRKKKGMRKSSSGNKINIEEIVFSAEPKNANWNVSPGANKQRRKMSLGRSTSNPELNAEDGDSSKSSRKKKGIQKTNKMGKSKQRQSTSALSSKGASRMSEEITDDDIYAAFGVTKDDGSSEDLKLDTSTPRQGIPKANANWNVSPGSNKQRRKMSLGRPTSNPELNAEDGDSSKSSRKKKGMRKSSSGNKINIDEIVFNSEPKKKRNSNKSMKRSGSGSKLDIDAMVINKSKAIKKRSMSMRRAQSGPTLDSGIPREIFATPNDVWNNDDAEPKVEKGEKGTRYKEKQTVWYKGKDGQKEEALILKIHLDDALEPFYDIKLKSGKEKQTDDAHLSPMRLSPMRRSQSVDRKPRRCQSVDRATATENMMRESSPMSARRRLKAKHNDHGKKSPKAKNQDTSKSPASIRKKRMSSSQSPGALRKAYRVL